MIKFRFLFLISLFITSCSSKKDILYMQNISQENVMNINYEEYKIKVDDILKIEITSEEPKASLIFSKTGVLNQVASNNKQVLEYSGFQVNFQGFINMPALGDIKVTGLTLIELKQKLFEEITNNQILLNPSIDIKVLNSYFTILGEVSKPGKYDFLKNNMNILEAIGTAGDLTINGKRENIKIIRNIGDKRDLIEIDLTDSDFFEQNFQIFSGDIIIVDPNFTKVKNAGIIGNSGTLLSLLSFILSSIIVINAN